MFFRTARLTANKKGYRIPKGAIVLPNIWAMNMNEKQYEHPERFNPERYLGPTPALESPVFGFGRRACLGVHYSTAAIFITVSSILSVFDLRAQDKDGKDVQIEPEFTGGTSSPSPSYPDTHALLLTGLCTPQDS
jgi:cytochrome P450